MKKLIIFRGPPGSGKSTISQRVAKRLKGKSLVFGKDGFLLGFKFINIDEAKTKKEFVNYLIINYLKKGFNVIIDGIYGGKKGSKTLNQLSRLAKKSHAEFYVISLHCSLKTSVKRCSGHRKEHIVPGNFPLNEIKKWYNYYYMTKYDKAIDLNTEEKTLNQVINQILRLIK